MTSTERAIARLNRVSVSTVRAALAAAKRGDPRPLRTLGIATTRDIDRAVRQAERDFTRVR